MTPSHDAKPNVSVKFVGDFISCFSREMKPMHMLASSEMTQKLRKLRKLRKLGKMIKGCEWMQRDAAGAERMREDEEKNCGMLMF